MGYSISDELKTKYLAREPQICNIRVDFLSGATQPGSRSYIILTDGDIVSQGLNIDRALFTGNTLELGTAISAESTITLNNSDGRFDKFHFEGAKLQIYVGLKSDGRNISAGTAGERVKSVSDDGNTVTVDTIRNIVNTVPMGTFWVDNCPRRAKRITLQCLDSFAKMDIVIPSSGHGISTNSIELHEMISQICSKFGLTLYATSGDSFSTYLQSLFPNTYNKQVTLPQIDEKLTYRALFQYCIQMLGGYAFMDWGNKVHIAKYGSSAVSPTITTDVRYTSDIQENSISVTGVSITYRDDEDVEHTSLDGTTDYAISMSGNPLINVENVSNLAHSVRSQTFGSWYYYPFSVKCKPMIWLYPLDKVAIKNQSGTSVTSYVTNTNFTLNGAMVLESKGETRYEKGWASSNAFTAQQTAIIEGLAKQDTSDLKQKYQDVLNLNELLAKSMGLWMKQISGVYYFYSVYGSSATTPPPMTGVDLSYGTHIGKDVIYTFGTNGFGWSTLFDSTITTQAQRNTLNTEDKIIEKLVWSYGTTVDGNAVLNRLRAYQISADYIQTGLLDSDDHQTYFDLTNSEICTTGSKDGNSFKTYLRGGDIEFYGSTSGGQMGKTAKMRTGYSEKTKDTVYTCDGSTTVFKYTGSFISIWKSLDGGTNYSSIPQSNYSYSDSDGEVTMTTPPSKGVKIKIVSSHKYKHFALGYISNDNSHATDGSSSLKLGAFATSDDHFIDLLEISGSSGAVFGTSSAKINAYIQGGHIETNVLKTSGEYVTEGNAFSTGLKHYSAQNIDHEIEHIASGNTRTFTFPKNSTYIKTEVIYPNDDTNTRYQSDDNYISFGSNDSNQTITYNEWTPSRNTKVIITYRNTAWRQHYFGSYVSQNERHWTGWQTYGSDNKFQQSFTSILYDNAEKDTNIFRISNPKYTVYVNFAGGQNVVFAKDYSAWNQNLGLLNLYCDDVKLSNGTSIPTSVKTQLSSLWENKAGTDVYTTLSDKAYSLSSLESDAGSTWGAFQIITKPDDNGNRKTCCSINANTSHVVSFKHFYSSNNYCTIEAAKFDVKSVEDIKKNISSAQTDALSLLKNSVIYNYDYIDEDEGEITEVTTPISIDDNGSSEGGESGTGESEEEGETLGSNLGFVIGRETPEEVISEDGTAVNLYSFTSLTWLACQQLLERIKTLEARVDELENPS